MPDALADARAELRTLRTALSDGFLGQSETIEAALTRLQNLISTAQDNGASLDEALRFQTELQSTESMFQQLGIYLASWTSQLANRGLTGDAYRASGPVDPAVPGRLLVQG